MTLNIRPRDKKFFTCFELIEHLHNPSKFIRKVGELMNKGDLFMFTTLSSTGVDIQTLWNNSRSVSPPHHINFFNPIPPKKKQRDLEKKNNAISNKKLRTFPYGN